MRDPLPTLPDRRVKNPTHRPRNEAFNWNVSTIAKALELHRNTVSKRLKAAGVTPVRHVHNSPVYRLSEAMPAIFGSQRHD